MYEDITKPPKPLPQSRLSQLLPGVSLLPPLSRRGNGPGVILLVPDSTNDPLAIVDGVPSPLLKWAEEGYVVVEIQAAALKAHEDVLQTAVAALKGCDKYEDTGRIGLVAYDAELWNQASSLLSAVPALTGAVIYANQTHAPKLAEASIPVLQHLAGQASGPPIRTPAKTAYAYPTAKSHLFATPLSDDFNYSAEGVSHTRNLSFLKPLVGGPFFDLEAIWDEHTHYEFADRSVEHTMSTMVQEPYVNHVPTLTGGIGRQPLSAFYRDHFIFQNSDDTEMELISRTVGIDRVIDEFIFKFTHDQEVDWLIPGVPPTGVKVEIPFTAVVNIRGDRLYHEHIAWDQGTVLRQLGLLPEYLPFPYPLPGGKVPAEGKQFEYRVPVAGVEAASKMREKDSVPSNEMFAFGVRETRQG